MKRPEYDDDKNIGDDTHGCPGVMRHWCDLEDYVNHLEKRIRVTVNELRALAGTGADGTALSRLAKYLDIEEAGE